MQSRTRSRRGAVSLGLLLVFGLAVSASAQPQGNLDAKVLGTTLGQPGQFELSGDAREVYVILVSLNQGPTNIGGKTLDVGLELLSITASLPGFISTLDGSGQAVVPYVLPANLPVGVTLYSQTTTLLTANKLDDISQQSVLVLSNPDTFTLTKGNLNTARALPTANLMDDCRVLITGGGSGDVTTPSALASAEAYDFRSQTFQSLPNMSRARSFHTGTKLGDGRVLIAGGNNSVGAVTTTCELFDPSTDSFSPTGAMGRARAGHTASLLNDGRVFVAGGTNDFSSVDAAISGSTATTEIYDPVTGQWSSGPNMSEPRFLADAIELVDGRTLVTGGLSFVTIIIPIPFISSDAQVLNTSGTSFSSAGNMGTERVVHTSSLLADGRVLVSGGGSGSVLDPASTASCEIYDPSGNSWSNTGSMAGARAFHHTFRLSDNRIFVAGGAAGTLSAPTVQTTVELYDPNTGSWSPSSSSMHVARAGEGASKLPDGAILYAGGADQSNNPTPTAERYTE